MAPSTTTTAQPRSQTPTLVAATAIGTIFLAFGLNAMFRPASAMEMFPLPYPSSSATSTELIDALMVVYGARDVFMGLAIYAAAAFGGSGGRKGLGWVLLAAGGVAGVDGWVVRGWEAGRGAAGGEWNHWGYAPFVGGLGMWLAMGR